MVDIPEALLLLCIWLPISLSTRQRNGRKKAHRAPKPLHPALCLARNACKDSAFPSRLPSAEADGKQGLPPHPPWRAEPHRPLRKKGKILKTIFFTLSMRQQSNKRPKAVLCPPGGSQLRDERVRGRETVGFSSTPNDRRAVALVPYMLGGWPQPRSSDRDDLASRIQAD
ncbi:MAG: hypothetical protein Greene041662_131 [Candidatus Peregrinibacteria bacterium Greene0416_62]|nr:MAG: hypothetical protein Greene041662_131 [Candidatus Peregrinibacteria bacterium Greene0416_62]TSC99924.1 MAG: hypothetical protein Greene101449_458 [Candidatus Peregrinibacteria bacterium Greene1014_49]